MKHLVAIIWCIAAATATAQTLTKTEAGRAAVGKCYSECSWRIGQLVYDLDNEWTRNAIWLSSDDFYYTDTDLYIRLLNNLVTGSWCPSLTGIYRVMVDCQMGCGDVERAYGTSTSSARNRYIERLRSARAYLQDAGLWRDGAPIASNHADFDQACLSFAASNNGSNSLPKFPRPLQR